MYLLHIFFTCTMIKRHKLLLEKYFTKMFYKVSQCAQIIYFNFVCLSLPECSAATGER